MQIFLLKNMVFIQLHIYNGYQLDCTKNGPLSPCDCGRVKGAKKLHQFHSLYVCSSHCYTACAYATDTNPPPAVPEWKQMTTWRLRNDNKSFFIFEWMRVCARKCMNKILTSKLNDLKIPFDGREELVSTWLDQYNWFKLVSDLKIFKEAFSSKNVIISLE